MAPPSVRLNGKSYVVIERSEYERLTMLANGPALPEFPGPNAKGHLPAKEYLRISIARDIIKDRVAAGWSQEDLARRAGIRVETLRKIESGKHTPSVATITKIDKVLKKAAKAKMKP